jgi:hypothetical protein
MPVLAEWTLDLTVDDVLRAQGADPAVVRERRPILVELAEQALETSRHLLVPRVSWCRHEVQGLRHEKLTLKNGLTLTGPLVAGQLGPAEQVVALICTVGGAIEAHSARAMEQDLLVGMAVDAVGSAAVELLANAACRRFEDEAAAQGLQTTVPLSPGMLEWPVDVGQPEIFSMFDADDLEVDLTESWTMLPLKSLSMILGMGRDVNADGSTCDYCAMQETCRYHDREAHSQRRVVNTSLR